ncbi:MAG: 30S ribosomal protein S19e [Candidatus Micrarchaeota archaeon]
MVTAYDVEANRLIESAAKKLKEMKIAKPAFVGLVKTGAHASRPPQSEDFWYVRCASILRQAYVQGSVGANRLRRHYGGKKRRGVRPGHHGPSGGSTIRKAMQELEKAGLLTKLKAGRTISAKGRKLLDSAAKESV